MDIIGEGLSAPAAEAARKSLVRDIANQPWELMLSLYSFSSGWGCNYDLAPQ